MADRLDSSIVRKLIEIKEPGDPLMLVLVSYLGAAFHASLVGGVRVSTIPHHEKLREILNGPPSNAKLEEPDMRIVQSVSHELELVYRIAIFDSFLNNLTS